MSENKWAAVSVVLVLAILLTVQIAIHIEEGRPAIVTLANGEEIKVVRCEEQTEYSWGSEIHIPTGVLLVVYEDGSTENLAPGYWRSYRRI